VKPAFLTFDCYGTLIDWRTGIEEALRALGLASPHGQGLLGAYMAAEAKEEGTYRSYRQVLQDTVVSLFHSLGLKVDGEKAATFAASVPRWPAFRDSAEFLREVGSMGYRRYILSNVDNDILEETVKNHQLEIDGVVTAEEVRSYKPAKGHWIEFMSRTGCSKDEILHVAQSTFHDIIPTQQMGIPSAWVNRYNEALPLGASPLIISDNLGNLVESLR
jgi:2-haloalkanoic acid dehalogenase type II